MKYPALAIAFSLAAGILAGGLFVHHLHHAFASSLLAAFFLIVIGFLLFFGHHHTSAGIAALLAWSLLGAAAAQLEPLTVPANHITRQIASLDAVENTSEAGQTNLINLTQPLRWRGRLRSDPLRLPWGVRDEIDLEAVQSSGIWRPATGGLRLSYFSNERDNPAAQESPAPADPIAAGRPLADPGVGLPASFRAGDRIEVLMRAAASRNFADPGSFDYKTFLARQDIALTGVLRSMALMTRLPGPPPTLAHRLARIRGRLLNEVDAMLAAGPPLGTADNVGRAAVARAMLLGDRSFLDSEQVQEFQVTGAYHVLVLAGLHVGILAAALFWIGRALRLPLPATTFFVLAALAFYLAIVQDRPPILRAATVAAIYLLARLLFRRAALLNSVGVAAIFILIVRPSELTDPSFQLSFLAAFTIAGIAAPLLSRTSERYRRALDHLGDATRDRATAPRVAQFRLDLRAAANWLETRLPASLSRFASPALTAPCRIALRLWELIVISLLLQIGMLPLMAQYFHRISPLGIVANIPAVLLTAVIVPFGFITLGAAIISQGLGHVLGRILSAAIGALLASVNFVAHFRWASFRVPSPPVPLLVAFFVIGALFSVGILAAWRWPARIAGAALLACATLIAAYPFSPRLARGQLEVTVIDVGQGDSIFVAFPDGRTMLVDGGGLPGGSYIHGHRPGIDIGEDVVSPYLWSRGLKRVDVVALTHGHEDHLGGLPAVLRNFRVGQLWVGHDVNSANYRGLLSLARSLGVPVVHRAEGQQIGWTDAQMRVLWPDNDDPVKSATNDDSLVLRLADGSESFLLTGDIERPVERNLVAQNAGGSQKDAPELSADFLKVPHHGSKTSSTQPFLDAVHPRYAAISVGASNTFGHPNEEVVERLSAEGAHIFRTDRNGAITALTDGHTLTIRTFLDSQSPVPPSPPSYRSSSIASPDTSSRSSAPAR